MKSDSAVPDLLRVRDLTVRYVDRFRDTEITAVSRVSLDLEANGALGLIGESGCGKSTLGHALMGYAKPTGQISGEIFFKGEDLPGMTGARLRRIRGDRIAMVHQNPYSALNPSLTLGAQLDEASILHCGMNRKQARQASLAIIESMGIAAPETTARRYPHQISGGMQQRIGIAMALLCRPELLILDEPTTALDVTTEAVILDLVGRLKDKRNTALLYISHDIGVIERVADRIAVMYLGELVESGPADAVLNAPRHPYTRALIDCLPRGGVTKDKRKLNAIPGFASVSERGQEPCPFAPRCQRKTETCQDFYGMRTVGEEAAPSAHMFACDRAVPQTEAPPDFRSRTDSREDADAGLALAADRLCMSFGKSKRRHRVLNDLSLTLPGNSILGIVGESGCGKTTLGLNVAGLYKPEHGELLFFGEKLRTLKHRDKDTLAAIQMIFQNPGRSLNPAYTLEQIIGRPLSKLMGIKSRKERRERAAAMLERVDLGPEYLNKRPRQLSGGEAQRAAIARVFISSPGLVVCDEPTSALDASAQASVLNMLTKLQRGAEDSFLFISHDLNVIRYVSDHIAVMYAGRIVEYGSRDQVINPPWHPYTRALLSAAADSVETIRIEGNPPGPGEKISGCPFHPRCPEKIGSVCERDFPPVCGIAADDSDNAHRILCHRFSDRAD